jgi:hypothetical protein
VDLARAEADLNTLIERRAREASKQRPLEDLWEASVKKDKERRRRALRAEWHAYFHRVERDLLAMAGDAGGGHS